MPPKNIQLSKNISVPLTVDESDPSANDAEEGLEEVSGRKVQMFCAVGLEGTLDGIVAFIAKVIGRRATALTF